MLGSASTQQFFASANSIAAVPNVWAEWNYNAFNPPYITLSSITSELSNSVFNNTNYWTNIGVGTKSINNIIIGVSGSGVGISNLSDTTASALSFKINSKISLDSTSTSTNTNANLIVGSVISNKFNLSGGDKAGRFYKFVFFVKTTGVNYTNGFTSKIPATSITATPTSTSAPKKTYKYNIIGVNSNNVSLQIDANNINFSKSVTVNTTASVNLSWTADKNATAYRIYRFDAIDSSITSYLTTVPSNSYVDDVSKNFPLSYAPATFSSHVFVTPSIQLYDSSNNEVTASGSFYVKTSNTFYGDMISNASSIEAKLDGWTRVEVWFGTPSDSNQNFSQFSLRLDMISEYEKSNLLVDNIELYEITESDYFLNEYYPTESAFKSLRPGESLTYLSLPSDDKIVNKDSITKVTKPVSFAVKNPDNYIYKHGLGPSIQILNAKTDIFKYYISSEKKQEIQAQYNNYMSINKIVIKHLNTYTTPISGSVILYTGPNRTQTKIQLTSSSFNSNGCTVLYYDGTNWSTIPWTSPPQLSSSATFQNVVSNVRGIGFISTNTPSSNPFGDGTTYFVNSARSHIIEISPRLEIDLSQYLISYNVKKELTSGQTSGFPFSYINSNSGNIEFSNIPVYSGNNAFSVFENSATSGTFTNLLRQGIKFTGFLSPASFQKDFNENIPQFVMYSNGWQVNDIDTVSVDLFDFTKNVLQTQISPTILIKESNLFYIITSMLAASGISDYDYDDLKNVCSTCGDTTLFYADETKTVFENLQDLFIVHQIGGYVDEYGILRFRNLGEIYNQILSASFAPTAVITDSLYTLTSNSASPTYIPNIIPNSYKENINEKIGVIQLRYEKPTMSYSINHNFNDGSYKYTLNSPQAYKEIEGKAVGMNYLDDNLTISQNYFYISPNNIVNGNRSIGENYSGIGFIGNEIVSFNGFESTFYPQDDSINVDMQISKIIRSKSDIDEGINLILQQFPQAQNVGRKLTGKIVGLQRGMYGTTPKDHLLITSSDLNNNFNQYAYDQSKGIATLTKQFGSISVPKNGTLQISNVAVGSYVLLSPKKKSVNYNLFAIDFSIPFKNDVYTLDGNYDSDHLLNAKKMSYYKNITTKDKNGKTVTKKSDVPSYYENFPDMSVGIFFNKPSSGTNGMLLAEIRSGQGKNTSSIKYFLNVYYYNNSKINYIIKNQLIGGKFFDGVRHRLALYFENKNLVVALDNVRVASVACDISINSGQNEFGAYLSNHDSEQNSDILLHELYADYVQPVGKPAVSVPANQYQIQSRYYFTTTENLTNIVKGKYIQNNCYLFQDKPRFQGLAFYDSKFHTAPIVNSTAEIIKIQYGANQSVDVTNAEANLMGPVKQDDLMYSKLLATPFGFKLLISNNCEEFVPLHSSTNNSDQSTTPDLQINAHFQTANLAETITRVINPGFQQSVSLGSKWFNTREDAEKTINILSKAMDTFYVDIGISIFANPLIQVGDYVNLIYSLKGIGYNQNTLSNKPITCLVSSITQGWGQGGEDTSLILKPILS
jgi:hypothetical protein